MKRKETCTRAVEGKRNCNIDHREHVSAKFACCGSFFQSYCAKVCALVSVENPPRNCKSRNIWQAVSKSQLMHVRYVKQLPYNGVKVSRRRPRYCSISVVALRRPINVSESESLPNVHTDDVIYTLDRCSRKIFMAKCRFRVL